MNRSWADFLPGTAILLLTLAVGTCCCCLPWFLDGDGLLGAQVFDDTSEFEERPESDCSGGATVGVLPIPQPDKLPAVLLGFATQAMPFAIATVIDSRGPPLS